MVTDPRLKTGIEIVLKQFGTREGRRVAGLSSLACCRLGGYLSFDAWRSGCRCLAVADGDEGDHETGQGDQAGDREGRAEAGGKGAVHGCVGEWGGRELVSGHRGGDGAHDRDSKRAPKLATDIEERGGQTRFVRLDSRDGDDAGGDESHSEANRKNYKWAKYVWDIAGVRRHGR